jgi:hypothetical protein
LSSHGILLAALFSFIATTSSAYAQTDSALGFFPLNVGDLHQFHYHYSYTWPCNPPTLNTHSSYHNEQVLGDTLLPTGFHYKRILSNVAGDQPVSYLRVDSATANVYRFVDGFPPREVLIDSLRSSVGSSFLRDDIPAECTAIDTMTVLGVPTLVKRYRFYIAPPQFYALAYGLGRVEHISFDGDDPCYSVPIFFSRDLAFARINGQEYGTYVSVSEQQGELPTHCELSQNYPNPFNPTTTIEFSLPQAGYVSLTVYNLFGQRIATLVSKEFQPGKHKVAWEATGVASGVYFYRLKAGEAVQTRRLILLK